MGDGLAEGVVKAGKETQEGVRESKKSEGEAAEVAKEGV